MDPRVVKPAVDRLFVAVDGWSLLARGLMLGYR